MPETNKTNTENAVEEKAAAKSTAKRTRTKKATPKPEPKARVFDKEELIPCMSVTTV